MFAHMKFSMTWNTRTIYNHVNSNITIRFWVILMCSHYSYFDHFHLDILCYLRAAENCGTYPSTVQFCWPQVILEYTIMYMYNFCKFGHYNFLYYGICTCMRGINLSLDGACEVCYTSLTSQLWPWIQALGVLLNWVCAITYIEHKFSDFSS